MSRRPLGLSEVTSRREPDEPQRAEVIVMLGGRVPESLRRDLRLRAVREGRPMDQLLQDAVRAYLETPE